MKNQSNANYRDFQTNEDKFPIVFMFSGQGSQYYQMGKVFFDNHAGFRQQMLQLDEMFLPFVGESMIDTIYSTKANKTAVFDNIMFTHPAIFMIEYSLCKTLFYEGIKPDYILGASLGELCAAAISDVIVIDECVAFIAEQAKIFRDDRASGLMIAILSNPEIYYQSPILTQYTEIASVNSDSHFVITLELKEVTRVLDYLTKNEIVFQVLNVKQGFHSKIIGSVENEYKCLAAKLNLSSPAFQIISTVNAKLKESFEYEYFWETVRQPIQFHGAIKFLESMGSFHYVDVGPMGTMAALCKQSIGLNSDSRVSPILTQFGQEYSNFEKLLARLVPQ